MIEDLSKEITILLADVLQYSNCVTKDSGKGLVAYSWLLISQEG